MKQESVIWYPRISPDRELKRWMESYFKQELPQETRLKNAAELCKRQWMTSSKTVWVISHPT